MGRLNTWMNVLSVFWELVVSMWRPLYASEEIRGGDLALALKASGYQARRPVTSLVPQWAAPNKAKRRRELKRRSPR